MMGIEPRGFYLMNVENMNKKIPKALLIINIAMLLILFISCFNLSIWTDEAFDLNMITHKFGYFLLNSRDASPPLHFAILKAFVDIFSFVFPNINSIYVAKFCSLVPYVVICVISNTYVKKKFGELAGALCGLLCITMPTLYTFGIQIRQYSWTVLLAFVWFVFFCEYVSNEKLVYAAVLALVGPISVFAHYYVVFGIVYAYVFYGIYCIVTKKYKQILMLVLSSIASSLIFSIWLYIALKSIVKTASTFWIPTVTSKDVISSFLFPFKLDVDKMYSGTFCAIIFIILICYFIYKWIKSKKSIDKVFVCIGLTMPFFVTIVGLLIGRFCFSVFQPRYVMTIMACFWMCFAISVSKDIVSNKWRMVLIAFLMIVASLDVAKHAKDEMEYSKNMKVLNNFLESNEGMLVVDDKRINACLPFYTSVDTIYIKTKDDLDFVVDNIRNNDQVFFLHSDMHDVDSTYMDKLKKEGVSFDYVSECGIEYVGVTIYRINCE